MSGSLVNGNTINSVVGLSSNESQLSNVGTYHDLTGSGASFSSGSASNYAITVTPNGTLTITPAALTITANNASRDMNTPNPTFTATYTGLKNNDNPNVVSGLTITTSATINSPAGDYPIVPANGTAQNYTITFVNGVLSVILTPPPMPPMPPTPTNNNAAQFNPAINANLIYDTIESSKNLQERSYPIRKHKDEDEEKKQKEARKKIEEAQ